MSRQFPVAAYYFPNYHHDPQNELVHGPGWNEWELVRRATPRYPGQRQPRLPLWGCEDEADPQAMARKIDAAADHGVDIFLFDWYWYEQGPYLERALDRGFLGAANHRRLQFALHWANHDWIDIHPASYLACKSGQHRLLYPGSISGRAFEQLTDAVVERYFLHPAYWKIDGAPFFSIYDLPALVRSFGGAAGARQALEHFQKKARAAGLPGIHFNQVLWNRGILPGEQAVRSPAQVLHELGFSSFTSYVWIHHVPLETFPETDYGAVFQKYLAYWDAVQAEIDLPYLPNATMGWDSSPRTVQSDAFANAGYPFTPCLGGNHPAAFKAVLQTIQARMQRCASPALTVNAWNEWTEGSYLEPDRETGLGYLEAIRDVFGLV